MKKLLAILLAALMILSLIGCAQSEPAAPATEAAPAAPAAAPEAAPEAGPATTADLKPANWPKDPITFLVGSAAGGGTDIMARALAEAMVIDTPVNIVNRAGASGTIAAEEVANSTPDGYTVDVGMPAAFYIQPHLIDLTYDPFEDFRHISVISPDEPLCIVVTPESPYETFQQVVDDMTNGVEVNFGTSNPGSVGNCGLSDVFMQLGIYDKLTMLPFGGAADTLTALLGGHIDVSTLDLAEAQPRVLNGQLRCLAVFGSERCAAMPDVPCTEEFGLENLDYVIAFKWISVPKDTPEDVVTYLKAVIDDAVLSEEYSAYIKGLNGLDTYALSEEELTQKLKDCYDSYDQVLRQIGTHKEVKAQ